MFSQRRRRRRRRSSLSISVKESATDRTNLFFSPHLKKNKTKTRNKNQTKTATTRKPSNCFTIFPLFPKYFQKKNIPKKLFLFRKKERVLALDVWKRKKERDANRRQNLFYLYLYKFGSFSLFFHYVSTVFPLNFEKIFPLLSNKTSLSKNETLYRKTT